MNHLSQNTILQLGKKIHRQLPFSDRDTQDMYHIGRCDRCYETLRCTIKMLDLTDHMDRYFLRETEPQASSQTSGEGVTAVIWIDINRIRAVLRQKETLDTQWFFDPALPRVDTRSGKGAASAAVRLEDNDNSQTYVSYDPGKRLLQIRFDCRKEQYTPRAFLKKKDGTLREIVFEKREHLLCADIWDIGDGEYELILEKR